MSSKSICFKVITKVKISQNFNYENTYKSPWLISYIQEIYKGNITINYDLNVIFKLNDFEDI